MSQWSSLPPAASDLEVSVFGPGVGECVVVHLGQNEWMVVDSCVDPATRRPVALDYLERLGVDVASAVKHVVVTHWHDDHIRGVSRVLEAATAARFACSAALRREEFKLLVAASTEMNMLAGVGSGVDELAESFRILQRRRSGMRPTSVGPEWLRADTLLHRRGANAGVGECEVYALSPSSATLTRGLHDIAYLLPVVGRPKRAAVSATPNDTALVLCVRVGSAQVVLGSDLEHGSPGTGWEAVLTTTAKPVQPVDAFKVPHHGSENAYHVGQWSQLLAADAVAVLTPFASGKKPLPTDEDIARLKGHTRHVFVTAQRAGKAAMADPMVQKTIGEVARSFRHRSARMGQVRVRMRPGDDRPIIELSGAAYAA